MHFLSSPWMLVPIFALLGVISYFLKKRSLKQEATDNPIIYNVDIETPLEQGLFAGGVWTKDADGNANGVTVRALKELGTIPQEALDAINRGVAHQIRNTSYAHPEWTNFRKLTDYQIFLIKPDTHTVEDDPGAPAIFVKNLIPGSTVNTYNIEAAGTCIGVAGGILGIKYDDSRYPSMVIPYEVGELPAHASYLEESARNESEHIAEWTNDKNVFAQFLGSGDVHPHFPIDPPATPEPQATETKQT